MLLPMLPMLCLGVTPLRQAFARASLARASRGACSAMATGGGSPPALLIFGAGYIGERVALQAIADGYTVYGTTRRREHAAQLSSMGVRPVQFDGDRPIAEENLRLLLPHITHVLSTIPPSMASDPVLTHHADAITAGMPALRWVGYFSSIAVYSDADGPDAWIDEDSPTRPSTPLGRVRLLSEDEWSALGRPVDIFRLAPVYGPGRGPHVAVREGTARAISRAGHVAPCAHVDDVAASVVAAMTRTPEAGAGASEGAATASVFNIVDDEPAAPADVVAHAARALGLPPPPALEYAAIEAQLSAPARSFWAAPRRVRSVRRAELGAGARLYPSYRVGIEAALLAEAAADRLAAIGAGDAEPPPIPPPLAAAPLSAPLMLKELGLAATWTATEREGSACLLRYARFASQEAAATALSTLVARGRAAVESADGVSEPRWSLRDGGELVVRVSAEGERSLRMAELEVAVRIEAALAELGV